MDKYFGTSYDQILQDNENFSMINTHCLQDDEDYIEDEEDFE